MRNQLAVYEKQTPLLERFKKIEIFLKEWQKIWQPSLLASYPKPLENIPESWLFYLQNASEQDLFLLSNYKCTGTNMPQGLPNSMRDLVIELRDLCDFPFYFHDQELLFSDPIYAQQINGLEMKKAHELRNLGPFVKDFSDFLQVSSLVEVGGGKGFLSLAASGCQAKHVIIDQVAGLLGKCESYFKRWRREKPLDCICCCIQNPSFQQQCCIENNSLIVGLHLCGNLTNDCLQSVVLSENKGVVSLGCCYHRLEIHQQNLSGYCQLYYGDSEFRLCLAPYHYKSIDTYRNNVIKNIYRFALFDIYCYKNGVPPIVKDLNVYDYPRKAEKIDFEDFLFVNAKQISCLGEKNEILQFYNEKSFEQALSMERFEYIRRFFSRILEVYLVLDRALFLKKSDLEVVLVQLFDGRISPRNLAIIGYKN